MWTLVENLNLLKNQYQECCLKSSLQVLNQTEDTLWWFQLSGRIMVPSKKWKSPMLNPVVIKSKLLLNKLLLVIGTIMVNDE